MPRIKQKKIADLIPDAKNINRHSKRGMQLLDNSIEKVGWTEAIVISNDDVVMSGNARHEKAKEKGFKDAIVIETDGSQPVVIKRKDIDSKSKAFAEAKIFANTVSKHNYVEDVEVAEIVCEEAEIEGVKAYGLGAPALERENVSFSVGTKPILKIEFESFDDLQEAEESIKDLLNDNWPGAKLTVRGNKA